MIFDCEILSLLNVDKLNESLEAEKKKLREWFFSNQRLFMDDLIASLDLGKDPEVSSIKDIRTTFTVLCQLGQANECSVRDGQGLLVKWKWPPF